MILQRLKDHVGQSVGKNIFRDKDSLAVVLPTLADLSLYTTLYEHIITASHDNICYILVDFSECKKLCDSGIAALLCLQKLARSLHLQLLMLDTPADMQEKLEVKLPDAYWIDMTPEVMQMTSMMLNKPAQMATGHSISLK